MITARASISLIIMTFQESHANLKVERSNIKNVTFDLNSNTGVVEVLLAYKAFTAQGVPRKMKGMSRIYFSRSYDWWNICGFKFPGFGD